MLLNITVKQFPFQADIPGKGMPDCHLSPYLNPYNSMLLMKQTF